VQAILVPAILVPVILMQVTLARRWPLAARAAAETRDHRGSCRVHPDLPGPDRRGCAGSA